MLLNKPMIFLTLSAFLLSSCDIIIPPKEVEEALSFETYGVPQPERQIQRFVNQFNRALIGQAIENGSPTALQMQGKSPTEKLDWPEAHDMVLLPLFSRAALEKAVDTTLGIGPGAQTSVSQQAIDKIDFNAQFALLIAHPAQVHASSGFGSSGSLEMSAYYFDTLLVKYSPADVLRIQLQTGRLGNPPLFPTKWKSHLFLLDRKDYKRLELNGKTKRTSTKFRLSRARVKTEIMEKFHSNDLGQPTMSVPAPEMQPSRGCEIRMTICKVNDTAAQHQLGPSNPAALAQRCVGKRRLCCDLKCRQ